MVEVAMVVGAQVVGMEEGMEHQEGVAIEEASVAVAVEDMLLTECISGLTWVNPQFKA